MQQFAESIPDVILHCGNKTKNASCIFGASRRRYLFFQKNIFSPATHLGAPAAATTAPLATPPRISILDQLPILTVDQRHDLLVRYFAHHDHPTDTPEQRATALGAWLDAAALGVSDIRRHQVVRFRSINDDTVVGTLGTGQGSGPSQLIYPYGFVVLDSPVCCFRLFFNCVISFFLPSLRFHS